MAAFTSPDIPTADEEGFRGDVLDLVRDLKLPLVRYPGGNFVSNYDWVDGIGPRAERPVRLDYAWRTTETNAIGTDEFVRWCKKAGTAPMLAVNLGSKGFTEALAMLEYCNHPGGSYWSDLRRKNGTKEPHDVRVWCLGNEMDGPWQMNHRTAYEYGRVANEVGRGMKTFDPSLELVACGSSHAQMPTYPDWEAEVLTECYDAVDYISLHTYWDNFDNDYLDFVAKSVPLDRYIHTVGGIIDYVKAKKRSKHDVFISFDEWNVWYHNRKQDAKDIESWNWPEAPPLLEDVYNFEDVLLVGCALNTFIRRSDRVKVACIAQLVNVIAPIMTENGGPAWMQTTYHPLRYASVHGRGEALNVTVDGPTYDCSVADDVPYLDVERRQERGRQDGDLLPGQPPPGRGADARPRHGRLRAEGAGRARQHHPSRPQGDQHRQAPRPGSAGEGQGRLGQGRGGARQASPAVLADASDSGLNGRRPGPRCPAASPTRLLTARKRRSIVIRII